MFDIVITWVKWSDKNFVNKLIEAGGRSEGCEDGEFIELKYLLRSIEKCDLKYNKIYIVHSDNHEPPNYLRETDKLKFIRHSQIVDKEENLPLIHRESILSHLHKIPGLSKYYFYFQDDLFINDKEIFTNIINLYKNNKIHIVKYKLGKQKYDVLESCGLWYQSTLNTNKLFNSKNDIVFEHFIQFFDREIMEEIENKYKINFEKTQSYKNQKLEVDKEEYLICMTTIFANYLIEEKNFEMINFNELNCKIIQTNNLSKKKKIRKKNNK